MTPTTVSRLPDRVKNRIWRQNAARKRVVLMGGTKKCRLCQASKSVSEFPVHRQMVGGRAHECRKCTNERQRKWRVRAAKRPEFIAARALSQQKARAKRYGLTHEELTALERDSGGVCAICRCPPKVERGGADASLHVDHCHGTGRVRGMLCADCNRAIGLLSDDPAIVRRAADYLATPK